jgi:hypothetical protein
VLIVAVGVLLLGVVAWSAGRAEVEGGASADAGSPVGESARNDIALLMVGAAGMVVVLVFLPFVFRRRDRLRGEREVENPVRWRRVVASLLVGLLAVYGMLLLARNDEDEPEPPAAPPPEAEDDDIQARESEGATGWHAVALIASGGVVVLVGAVVVRHRMRGARPQVDGAHVPVALEELSQVELERLEPSEAVRLAYAGALRQLSTVGAGRREAETPREHLARVRSLAPAAVDALSVLIARYEIVRFSHHPITDEMKDDAVRAYRSLAMTVDEMTSVGEVMAP